LKGNSFKLQILQNNLLKYEKKRSILNVLVKNVYLAYIFNVLEAIMTVCNCAVRNVIYITVWSWVFQTIHIFRDMFIKEIFAEADVIFLVNISRI
jgi:hypothetical protein